MSQKKAQKAITIIDRRRKELELRRSGATYEAIAQTIGKEFQLKSYTRSRAFEDVQFGLQELKSKVWLTIASTPIALPKYTKSLSDRPNQPPIALKVPAPTIAPNLTLAIVIF